MPVSTFPGRVVTQNKLTVRNAFPVAPPGFAVRHKLLEYCQVDQLKPTALKHTPIVIPGLDQIAAVKVDGRLKGPYLTVGEFLAWDITIKIVCLLKCRYIEPA